MRKLLSVSVIILFLSFYNSCTKDKTPPPPDCDLTDTLNTYTNSVKEIMDISCATAGCHDAITAYSGIRLDTYDATVDATKNHAKFFCVIEHSCTPYMPNAGDKLADSLINKIQAWKANCYAQ